MEKYHSIVTARTTSTAEAWLRLGWQVITRHGEAVILGVPFRRPLPFGA